MYHLCNFYENFMACVSHTCNELLKFEGNLFMGFQNYGDLKLRGLVIEFLVPLVAKVYVRPQNLFGRATTCLSYYRVSPCRVCWG